MLLPAIRISLGGWGERGTLFQSEMFARIESDISGVLFELPQLQHFQLEPVHAFNSTTLLINRL